MICTAVHHSCQLLIIIICREETSQYFNPLDDYSTNFHNSSTKFEQHVHVYILNPPINARCK